MSGVFRRATRPAGRPASDISSHTVRTVDTKTILAGESRRNGRLPLRVR